MQKIRCMQRIRSGRQSVRGRRHRGFRFLPVSPFRLSFPDFFPGRFSREIFFCRRRGQLSIRMGIIHALFHLLFGQKAVPGMKRILPDLIQMGKIDGDLRPSGLKLCLPFGGNHRFHVRSRPAFFGIILQIVSCFQVSAQHPVRFAQKPLKPLPVKIQPVVSLFLPYAVAAVIGSAGIQHIIGIRMGLRLPVDGVGKGMPGEGLLFPEAVREKIPALPGPGFGHGTPDSREQTFPPFPILFHNGRLFQLFLPCKAAERGKNLFIRSVLRIF